MAFSVGIFRIRSQRPFQRAIRQKFIVPGPSAAPADVQEPGYLAAIKQQRQQLGRKRLALPRTYWQRKPYVLGVAAPPDVQEPGYLAAVRSLRKQLGREQPTDLTPWRQHRETVRYARHHDIGYLAAIRVQRQQLGRRKEEFDVRWQLKKKPVLGVFVPPVVQEPGYLAAIRQQRQQLGRERVEFDVRWQLHRRQVVSGKPRELDIGWLASWIYKRAYGHNLRR